MAWNDKICWTACSCGCAGTLWVKKYHLLPARFKTDGLPRYIRGHYLKEARHPDWKGDEAGSEAKHARARRKFKLNNCEDCGKLAIDRHHEDGNPGNNSAENVFSLCRRCHMIRDGRLEKLRKMCPPTKDPKPCTNCQKLSKPLRRGLCHACNEYMRRNGKHRPRREDWYKKGITEKRKAPCLDCGNPAGRFSGRVVRGRCSTCYSKVWKKERATA